MASTTTRAAAPNGDNLGGNGASAPSSSFPSSWNCYVPFGSETDDGACLEASGNNKTKRQNKTTFGEEEEEEEEDNAPNGVRENLSVFWSMSLPYFREKTEARCHFGGLVILMLLDSSARIAFSYLARDFWSALGDKDADRFYGVVRTFLVALCLLAPINVLYRFQRQRLAIRWRKWMTERILELYFYNPHRVYYRLEQQQQQQQQQQQRGIGGAKKKAIAFVDNPDQRLAEDVRSFTQYSLSLFLTVAISCIDLAAFSVVLYTIEPNLFVSIIAFAAFGTLATWVLGKDLVRLNFRRLSREADFRYSLVRLREHAESIAFFRGEATEGREVRKRFDRLLENDYAVIGKQRNLEFFTVSYNYLTWLLPVVVIAPQYMEGLVELGVVQQAAAAFGHVLDDLSLIINEFEGLSEFSASIGRLHQFLRAVRDADPSRNSGNMDSDGDGGAAFLMGRPSSASGSGDGIFRSAPESGGVGLGDTTTTTSEESPSLALREFPPSSGLSVTGGGTSALSIRNLCLYTPDALSSGGSTPSSSGDPKRRQQQLQQPRGRILIQNLCLELEWGKRLLIIGPSGVGKSSLLRAIAGLWTSGTGSIDRAGASDVYFLPQKPYCPLGTLRDQLLYPFRSSESDVPANAATKAVPEAPSESENRKLLGILDKTGLGKLAGRSGDGDPIRGLDAVVDWGNVLSLGEQQRLAFGRILYHEPSLVILDEATSATDVSAEENLYGLLEGTTYVSVGHRPTLLRYHDTRLCLFGEGRHPRNPESNEATSAEITSETANWTIGPISSEAGRVASEEVDLFYR